MENNLTYTPTGDYLIPDLKLTEQPETPLGKYGRMRQKYLKEHRPILWNRLILSEELAQVAGATEALKAQDPMKWVGLMNNCKAQAEEIILNELVFS